MWNISCSYAKRFVAFSHALRRRAFKGNHVHDSEVVIDAHAHDVQFLRASRVALIASHGMVKRCFADRIGDGKLDSLFSWSRYAQ